MRKTSTVRSVKLMRTSVKKEVMNTTKDILKIYKKVLNKCGDIFEEFDITFGESDERTTMFFDIHSKYVKEFNKIVKNNKSFTKQTLNSRKKKVLEDLDSLVQFSELKL